VPFNLEIVLSKLDVRLQTPIFSTPPPLEADPWVSQTPRNPTDALSQTTLVKNRIARHEGSSPTPIFETVATLAKGTELLAHQLTLVTAENRILREANQALSRRRRAKKTRVRQGGALTIEDVQDVLARRDIEEQVRCDKRSERGTQKEGQLPERRCRTCGKSGHNARTCREVVVMLGSPDLS
jgi:hypothetical protein